jgi:hypothetical protein
MADIRQRVERRRRRRAARVVGTGCVVVAVSVGGFAIANADNDPSQVTLGARPKGLPVPSLRARGITRPVLDMCTPTRADEGTMTGTGHTDPPTPAEVFADPSKGAAGPIAVLSPPTKDTSPLNANTTVGGRPAALTLSDMGQSNLQWQLADGSRPILYGRYLPDPLALAEAITAKSKVLPSGLVSFGTVAKTSWARSICLDRNGVVGSVEVVRGTRASRYARVNEQVPTFSWDVGDATYLVNTPPPGPAKRPTIRQATVAEWNALLAKTAEVPTGG